MNFISGKASVSNKYKELQNIGKYLYDSVILKCLWSATFGCVIPQESMYTELRVELAVDHSQFAYSHFAYFGPKSGV